MGDIKHVDTYDIGSKFPYYIETENEARKTELPGFKKSSYVDDNYVEYWTRSPAADNLVYVVDKKGKFYADPYIYDDGFNVTTGAPDSGILSGHISFTAARPALNLKSDVKDHLIPNKEGVYEIKWK